MTVTFIIGLAVVAFSAGWFLASVVACGLSDEALSAGYRAGRCSVASKRAPGDIQAPDASTREAARARIPAGPPPLAQPLADEVSGLDELAVQRGSKILPHEPWPDPPLVARNGER